MEFFKKDLFITDFWEFKFPYHEEFKSQVFKYLDSPEVKKYLESIENNNPSKTSYGGEEIPIDNEVINNLLATQITKFLKEIEKVHIWEEDNWHSFDCWINLNKKGGFNPPHVHPAQTYSGVYYISSPKNCGNIHFLDPRPTPVFCTPDLECDQDSNIYANQNPYDIKCIY